MSISVRIRDYVEQIRPLFYQNNKLGNRNLRNILQFFFVFLEANLTSRFSNLFSFSWLHNLIYFPILRPNIQLARTSSGLFSSLPLYARRDRLPKNLNLSIPLDTHFSTYAFQIGFLQSIVYFIISRAS